MRRFNLIVFASAQARRDGRGSLLIDSAGNDVNYSPGNALSMTRNSVAIVPTRGKIGARESIAPRFDSTIPPPASFQPGRFYRCFVTLSSCFFLIKIEREKQNVSKAADGAQVTKGESIRRSVAHRQCLTISWQ